METKSISRTVLVCCMSVYSATFIVLSICQYYKTYTLKQQYLNESDKLNLLEKHCGSTDDDELRQEVLALLELGKLVPTSVAHGVKKRQTTSLETMFKQLMSLQESILEQHCTSNSSLCERGMKGKPGLKGETGTPGIHGQKGLSGQRGETGLRGTQGPIGENGPQGVQGSSGEYGRSGLQGVLGDQGTKGEKGLQGTIGDPGDSGIKGNPGLRGNNGSVGELGQKGLPGDIGPKGFTGVSGNKGLKGEPGLQGNDGQILDQDCVCSLKNILSNDNSVQVGTKSFRINCTTNDLVSTPYIMWLKDGQPIKSRITVSADKQFITIPEVHPSDFGNYSCWANGKQLSYYQLKASGISRYSCDFESRNTCAWQQQSNGDDFDWRINQGSTSSTATGPDNDHTIGTNEGSYMYIETSNNNDGEYAELMSPVLSGNHDRCLNLWYHMFGSNIGKLVVGIETGGKYNILKTISGEQGFQWKHLSVNLSASLDLRVSIRGYRGNGYHGDIGIDDIVLTDGGCT